MGKYMLEKKRDMTEKAKGGEEKQDRKGKGRTVAITEGEKQREAWYRWKHEKGFGNL